MATGLEEKCVQRICENNNFWKFAYNDGFGARATEIIFPEGRADQRFYIKGFEFPGHGRQKGYHGIVLEYETRQAGEIKPEWIVELREVPQKPSKPVHRNPISVGTLIGMLDTENFKTHSRVPKKILARLSTREGYARYSTIARFPRDQTF